MSKTYVGDTGTTIVLDCGQDISAATQRTIEVRKPNRTTTTWAATAEGATSLKFTTLQGTLDMAGDWALQAKVALPGGVWRGETVVLKVWNPFA
jgi:hypothetical protein